MESKAKRSIRKVRVGFDLDGIYYRWDDTTRYLLKSQFGINYLTPSTDWDYIPRTLKEHGDEQAWNWLWTEGVTEHGLFRYGSIYKGSREAVKRLRSVSENIVITSRPSNAVLDTEDWLSYQRLPHIGVHIIGRNQKKSDILPHCDVYLDDASHNAVDILENTDAWMLLFDRPYNQIVETTRRDKLIRVFTWAEVETEINKIYKEINKDVT